MITSWTTPLRQAAIMALLAGGMLAATPGADAQPQRGPAWQGMATMESRLDRAEREVFQALEQSFGSEAYYDAMEAAADELEDEDLVSEATEDFFERMARRDNWGTYGRLD